MSDFFAGRRCVVTGGAGFIGSHVTDELVRRGASVLVVDDLSVGKEANLADALATGRAKFERRDVRDFESMRGALHGADTVFHIAVLCLRLSLKDPSVVHDVNATGTLNVLRAAEESHVRRFVYCSSSEVYGTAVHDEHPMTEEDPLLPTTPYGASKAAGELYALSFHTSYGLPTTIVRPFNTYGPRSHANGPYGEVIPRFVARVLAGERPVIFGDGLQTRDFTYVDDTARGIVRASEVDSTVGTAVNIARGVEISIKELARRVAAACGRSDLEPLLEEARPADVRRHHAATGKAEKLMGYRARIDLEEGVERYLAWIKERGVTVSAAEARSRNW